METSHLRDLIEHYGYFVVFIGTLLEGETVLIMAGFSAHRGYLDLGWVVAVATVGGFTGDQVFFMIGRVRGRQILSRFPGLQTQSVRVEQLVNQYHTWLIVGVRFMYGLRIAGPVLLGMSNVRYLRFVGFNLLGALIWATLIGGAGYLFGQTVELFLEDAKRYEALVLGLVLSVGIGVWLYRKIRRGARSRKNEV